MSSLTTYQIQYKQSGNWLVLKDETDFPWELLFPIQTRQVAMMYARWHNDVPNWSNGQWKLVDSHGNETPIVTKS